MSLRTARAALALLAALASLPALAAPRPELREELLALQALDARVQSVGWKLVRSNARFCANPVKGIGLQLMDAAGFAGPAAVRAALALPHDIAVEAVAADGPAARAGLAANTPLSTVADQSVAALPEAKSGDYARLAGLHDRVDAALAAHGAASFVRADGTTLNVAGETVCATRFEMLSGTSRAAADGARVTIGRKLVEDLPEDELLAAALAHELAHNLLGHRVRLDASGRSWGRVKATEREADRLSVWLLANAGYDPSAAVRFFERWGPKNDYGIFSTPDHDRWKTRVKLITAESAAMAKSGGADWARDFKRS